MPKLAKMFPSRYLSAEDLPPGQRVPVTITDVVPVAGRDRMDGSEPELKWLIRFAEFRKGLTLWRTSANVIAKVLGTDVTEEWVGRRIAIYGGTYTSFGEIKPCVLVDEQAPPGLPAGRSARPAGLIIDHDRRPIPKPIMDRFMANAGRLGGSWDGFMRWLKVSAPDGLPLVFGVDMDAIPAGVLPALKRYLDSLTTPAIAPDAEVVDPFTGEVLSAAPAHPSTAGTASESADVVDDSEVPF